MRRIPALLCVAGLATAPASVAAGPSHDPWSTTRAQAAEKLERSSAQARTGVEVHGKKLEAAPDVRPEAGDGERANLMWAPPWLRAWLKPPEQEKSFFDKLRELFATKNGPASQRS